MTLSEASFKIRLDIGALSRFERALGSISREKQRHLEDVLAAAIHARMRAIEAAMAQDHTDESVRMTVTGE